MRDPQGRIGPYAYLRDQWVSFDDIDMIRHKSSYIKAMGLGGGMIWALDLDDFKNLCGCEEYPLLRTINRVLRNYAKPDPKCVLGEKLTRPTSTSRPTSTTIGPTTSTTEQIIPGIVEIMQPSIPSMSCVGRFFVPHETNCNEYYMCNQGQLQLQVCPSGLYWNKDHCDWPENSECHPDGTTTEMAVVATPEITTAVPSQSTTSPYPVVIDPNGYKVVCYFTNWAWYRQGDGKYLPQDIDPTLCTHINYGFAVLDSNTLTIKPHDSWADIDNGI